MGNILGNYKITRKQQLKELNSRVTPVVNIDVVVARKGRFLVGRRAKGAPDQHNSDHWLFPGSRMRYDEKPHDTALRVLKNELPGVSAKLKKLITAISDKGWDKRAYGVTLYYLFEYVNGTPEKNSQLDKFEWVNEEEFSKLSGAYPLELNIFREINQTVRTMNTTEDEILVEVDKDNKEIGSIVKRDAHSNPTRYHRAAHIMLFNSNGEVILQQRSLNKTHSPGMWDMPGGHQIIGNTISETAKQELQEEMGVRAKLTLKRIGLKTTGNQSEYYYLFFGKHDGPYKFDKNEVEQVKAFNCQMLLDGKYDKDFQILTHVREYLHELKHYWKKLIKQSS